MKIQPHELRMGNYVNYFGRVVEVKGVKAYSSQLLYNGGCDDLAFIDGSVLPIPITEEWLLNFGWKWNDEIKYYENSDVRMFLDYRPVNGSYTMFNYVIRAKITDFIWHVHQLQNLHFALTGKELKCDISKIE